LRTLDHKRTASGGGSHAEQGALSRSGKGFAFCARSFTCACARARARKLLVWLRTEHKSSTYKKPCFVGFVLFQDPNAAENHDKKLFFGFIIS
jgi:hypothetical protein